jgi:hypothetical protein
MMAAAAAAATGVVVLVLVLVLVLLPLVVVAQRALVCEKDRGAEAAVRKVRELRERAAAGLWREKREGRVQWSRI